MDISELLQHAKEAQKYAYAPYSGYMVGAAVLCGDKVFKGCNVENSSYGLTICAERVAIFNAVSQGCRDIEAVAIYAEKMPYPCGACLQVMSEFCKENCIVLISDGKRVEKYELRELLPKRFRL